MKKNGRNLTKAQIKKIERIDKLFADLKKQGVKPMIYEGGGHPCLTFWRDASLDIDDLYKYRYKNANNYFSAKTLIDMWAP